MPATSGARKRGGELARQDLDALEIALPEIPEDLVALDEALNKLAATDKTAADLVHLRFFAGLPLPETAQLLGISPRTADRLWAYARAWLHQEIQGRSPPKVTFLEIRGVIRPGIPH